MSPTQSERLRQASRERRAHQKEDLRQAILMEASNLIYEKGYEGFSLRQLAERIGYSATTIYLYFKDKDDLLATLVEERFGKWIDSLAVAASAVKDPIERLSLFGKAYVEFGLSDPAFFRAIRLQRADLLSKVIGAERLAIPEKIIQQTLQEAIDAGRIAPCNVEDTGNALWAMSHGIITIIVTIPKFSPEQIQGMVNAAHTLMLKGLR